MPPEERVPAACLWRLPPADLRLPEDEVHVWRGYSGPTACVPALREVLTPDELARADRYRFQRDRDCFVICRGALRAILGRYLNVQPETLRFSTNPYGKPVLAGPHRGILCFNVSHSGDLALFAVASGRRVGVDLERLRPGRADERLRIAERFFSPPEAAELRALPKGQRNDAFFVCWTRKEAYIKAVGQGLSLPLSRFEVAASPASPAALLRTAWDAEDASRWSMRDLNPGPGYVGTVAAEGSGWRLRCWQRPG